MDRSGLLGAVVAFVSILALAAALTVGAVFVGHLWPPAPQQINIRIIQP